MQEDSTRILSEGTAAYPLDPAAAGADEQCPHCQAVIAAGEQFCARCGYQRGSWREGQEAAPETVASVEASGFVLEGAGGARYSLPLGLSIVGRSDDADVTIVDGYISRRHARFTVRDDAVSVADLGSANGTFVGEERLKPEVETPLTAGGGLRLGQTELILVAVEVSQEGEDAADEQAEETHIMVQEESAGGGPPTGDEERIPGGLVEVHLDVKPAPSPWQLRRRATEEVLYLPYGESLLGRKPDRTTMVIRGDGYISGLHCRIVASLENLEITDLGSTNGSYVNGERCAPDHVMALSAGDLLRLGATELDVAYEEQAEGAGGEGEDAAEESGGETPEPESPEA
jgi:pSer/pThr/pTyr-binding forkhead associated (FHA) protein